MTASSPIVPDADQYTINTQWGRRRETPEALATRWIALIIQLQALDSSSARWSHWDSEQNCPVTFEPDPKVWAARILAATETTPEGKQLPEAGARVHNVRGPYPRSRGLCVSALAGKHDADCVSPPSPGTITYMTTKISTSTRIPAPFPTRMS